MSISSAGIDDGKSFEFTTARIKLFFGICPALFAYDYQFSNGYFSQLELGGPFLTIG